MTAPAGTRGLWWRWLFLLPGLAAVGYGASGLLTADVPLVAWATWFVGSALLHDLLLAPVWIGLGWGAARVLPRAARPAAVVGGVVAGVLALVAFPFVLGYGADADNPSFLPHDVGRNLLLIVVAVLVVTAVWGTVATVRERRPVRSASGPPTGGGRA
jgi:hypothetical protein